MDKADKGIKRAIDHADAVEPGWGELAFDMLCDYLKYGVAFTAPDVRGYSSLRGLPEPPSKRAWGGVFNKAQRNGLISCVGFGTASNEMHRQPIRIWQSKAGRSQARAAGTQGATRRPREGLVA